MARFWPKTPKTKTTRGRSILAGLGLFWSILGQEAISAGAPTAEPALAPGYSTLPYPAPAPGSYTLPRMGAAKDAELLDSKGQKTQLLSLLQGRITIVSFIYASCNEVNGCPLATYTLAKTQQALDSDPKLLADVQFLTISFDPEHDTPEVMARYGSPFLKEGLNWRFLTSPSRAMADQMLKDYQQTITPEIDAKGQSSGRYSHVLRILLIDPKTQIRNSYTPSVLHTDLLLADIRTLEMDGPPKKTQKQNTDPAFHGAGDDKRHYDQTTYQTQSAALNERQGKVQDLLELMSASTLGLPKDPSEERSPLSKQKVALGRKLFFDRRLSLNGTFSCAMCHIPEQGFTSQEQSTAIGIEGRTVRRNAPTIFNTGRLRSFFHDGRENRLEQQVWGPLLAPNEMGNPSVGQVVDKITSDPAYLDLFQTAYGKAPSMDSIGEALAQYERTLIAGNSPFDAWRFGGQPQAIGRLAQKGYALFTGKAGCSQCHSLDTNSALFSDESFHNTGIGYRDSMGNTQTKTRVQLAPGVWTDLDQEAIERVSEKKPSDLGRYEITQNPEDRWKYRTPSLRNVALTAPYMHDGSIKSLEEVIGFYQQGGFQNPSLDPLIRPLQLSREDIDALMAFLNTLTGKSIDLLIEDAWAVPVGDPASH